MEDETVGTGIRFLPGDKIELLEQLELLLSESEAGNTVSAREEIMAILENLLSLHQSADQKVKIFNATYLDSIPY